MTNPSVEDRLEALERELTLLKDQQAIRKLQFAYGYYMDRCLFPPIVDLFADDAVLYFINGVFYGKEGARRLYGGGSGLTGPVRGMMFEHILAQDIVDVAPDGKTAKGRFRTFMYGGVHETKTDAPSRIPPQFWEAGVYENEYVKVDGVWKFKVFNYRIQMQARYEDGWAKTPDHLLMVVPYENTYPENPRGPDELRPQPPRWPEPVIQPYHYLHPVTGEPVQV